MGAMAADVPDCNSLFFTGVLGFVFFAPALRTRMLVQSFFHAWKTFSKRSA
jgi:hypothetical protein